MKLPSLQEEIKEILRDLVHSFLKPALLYYAQRYGHRLSEAAARGISVLDLVRHHNPQLLAVLDQVRRFRNYIDWNTEEYTQMLCNFLRENGVSIGPLEEAWIRRQVEEVRRVIYS